MPSGGSCESWPSGEWTLERPNNWRFAELRNSSREVLLWPEIIAAHKYLLKFSVHISKIILSHQLKLQVLQEVTAKAEDIVRLWLRIGVVTWNSPWLHRSMWYNVEITTHQLFYTWKQSTDSLLIGHLPVVLLASLSASLVGGLEPGKWNHLEFTENFRKYLTVVICLFIFPVVYFITHI